MHKTKEEIISILDNENLEVSDEVIADYISLLLDNRDICNLLGANAQFVLKELLSNSNFKSVCVPIDISELRLILSGEYAVSRLALPVHFALKYCRSYSAYLIIDVSSNDIGSQVGDAYVVSSLGSLSNLISNIYINSVYESSINDANHIVKTEGKNIMIGVCNAVKHVSTGYTKLAQVTNNISLSSKEKDIFGLLNDVVSFFHLPIELRVAGGWVRDKVMGIDSDDIDIAIGGMSGKNFVSYVVKYINDNGFNNVLGKTYIVDQNIEKSKHLETAGIDLFGQKIEFVGLRSEMYSSGSRIPEVESTMDPKEDALRRDLTINALFYNIKTGQVEDYVGGLNDIKNKTLRTPMDPKKTFQDDPLRLLRVLRFKSKYNDFDIDQDVKNALFDKEIHNAYRNKISPERAGTELWKMMSYDPYESVRILFETDLYKYVFDIPELADLNHISMDQMTPYHKYNLMEHTLKVLKNNIEYGKSKNLPPERAALRNMSALFHDFGKMDKLIQKPHPKNEGQMQYIGHEYRSAELADKILKYLGLGKSSRDYIERIILHHMRPHTKSWSDKAIGKLISSLKIPGQEDTISNLLEDLYDHAMADEMASDESQADLDLKKNHYNQFLNYMNSARDKKIDISKPILNGKEIMNMFPGLDPKTGFIKYVIDLLVDKRLDNMALTKDQAIEFVNSIRNDVLNKFSQNKASKHKVEWFKSAQNLAMPLDGYMTAEPRPANKFDKVQLLNRQVVPNYYRGQSVISRLGMGHGIVIDVSDKVKIKWNNGKTIEYTNDERVLTYNIQRIN